MKKLKYLLIELILVVFIVCGGILMGFRDALILQGFDPAVLGISFIAGGAFALICTAVTMFVSKMEKD